MSTSIFITGGAGFIATSLVELLLKQYLGSPIWLYDNLHEQVHGANAEFVSKYPEVTFIKGDIVDKQHLIESVKVANPDIIFHLASETGTGQSYDEVSRYCNVNVTGTANLIEAVRFLNKKCKIILSSSRAVYGEGAYVDERGSMYFGLTRDINKMKSGDYFVGLPNDPDSALSPVSSNSDFSVSPTSVYAATKLMQEYLLKTTTSGSNIQIAILRFQNVYGPGQSLNNPYTGVLSIFCKQIIAGQKLEIYEDGLIVRDFVYVDDVSEALMKAAFLETSNEIIDVGLGKPVTIIDAAKILMQYLGATKDNYFISGKFRIGDIRYAVADINRAKTILNWEPKISIEEGLMRLARWVEES